MNFLLNADLDVTKEKLWETDAVPELLGFGGQVFLIGILTVFAVLSLLWACLVAFKIVFHDIPAKRAQKVVAENKVVESVVDPEPTVSDDEEIVAVIAAAIAAAESESGGLAKFRVVSFRRS